MTPPRLENRLPPEDLLERDEHPLRELAWLLAASLAALAVVVLATGFVAEWPWLDVPGALDSHGYPLGDFGVSPQPGLFFIGMHNLQRMSSSFLCNGGRDARDLLPAILRHLGRSGSTGIDPG